MTQRQGPPIVEAVEEKVLTTGVCEICGSPHMFRWTDSHGVGACQTCGACYKILHYEGEGADRRRVEKPPALAYKPEWVPLTRKYWQEMHRNCDPGGFNFPGSSYEVASAEDFRAYEEWMEAHKDEWPEQ